MMTTAVSVGGNGTKISFGEWDAVGSDGEPGNPRTVAVAIFSSNSAGTATIFC